MKKTIILVLFAAILFSACDSITDPDNIVLPKFLSDSYTFRADYSAEGIEGELEFKKSGIEQCELTFLSPDSIEGMALQIEDGNVKTEFMGIRYECPISQLANDYPVVLIYNVLSGTGEKPVSVKTDKETGNVTYEFADGAKLVVNDDAPVSIELPSMSIVLTVTSFEKLAGSE